MDAHYSVEGAILKGRYTPPSHYLFKIQSFSKLAKAVDNYRSDKFDAEGFNWKLSIYPTGDESKDGEGYISIYLELVDTISLPVGWDANVIVNFFVFNHFQNTYLSFQDGSVRRYHALKTTWGITKFIDLETFSDPQNGYLSDDTCVFGLEVFVVRASFKSDRLSMMKEPSTYFYTWKIPKFSSISNENYYSYCFGFYDWYIGLCPVGYNEGRGNNIALFLHLTKSKLPADVKVFVKVVLRVKDQIINANHVELGVNHVYSSNSSSIGPLDFLSLAKLKDPKLGFLVDDTLIIEAEVTLLGMVLKAS